MHRSVDPVGRRSHGGALECVSCVSTPVRTTVTEKMGGRFRYISDSALVAINPRDFADIDYDLEHCKVCGRKITLYDVTGGYVGPDGDEMDTGEACADCINFGLIRQYDLDGTKKTLAEYVRAFFPNDSHIDVRIQELHARLDRTPIAVASFMQSPDWPACCGDLTEYIGNPKWRRELRKLMVKSIYWERGVKKPSFDFRRDGPPESMSDVCKFRCPRCRKEYWTFQFT